MEKKEEELTLKEERRANKIKEEEKERERENSGSRRIKRRRKENRLRSSWRVRAALRQARG